MPRLDDALVEARRFADHPPAAPPPLAELQRRTRGRRVRHRLIGATVAAIALLATGLGVTIATHDDNAVRVTESNEPSPSVVTAPGAGQDATALPATDLDDGDTVTVEFAAPAQPGLAAECAADAIVPNGDATAWCDQNVRPQSSADGTTVTFHVSRVIETSNGLIDCAAAPRRCVLGTYRSGSNGSPMWAAISFRGDLPPIAAPTISIADTNLANGEAIAISGTGYRAGEDVFVTQCTGRSPEECDLMGDARVTADDDGAFATELRVRAEILTYEGWRPCDPCQLHAGAFRVEAVVIPITVIPNDQPSRPVVQIVESGPYAPEQHVTIAGSGFPAGGIDMTIGWCRLDTPDGYLDCVYPSAGFVAAADDGTVDIADYPMPSADFGCRARERCALAWLPGEGSPPAFTTPFEMAASP